MKISNHFLEGAVRDLLPGGEPMKTRRLLVIHFTSGASAKSSIDFWRSPGAKGANAHVVIDRNGTIFQCRPFDRTAAHAGVSRWLDPTTKQVRSGCNAFSIGIELANAGDDSALAGHWSKLAPLYATHKNLEDKGPWEQYPQEQLEACFELARLLVDTYHLDDVVGHEDIAPERKNDPGPAFPMEDLRALCGFHGAPHVNHAG